MNHEKQHELGFHGTAPSMFCKLCAAEPSDDVAKLRTEVAKYKLRFEQLCELTKALPFVKRPAKRSSRASDSENIAHRFDAVRDFLRAEGVL